MTVDSVREAIRGLLLPIDHAREAEAVAAAVDALDRAGVDSADQAELIRVDLAAWREGEPLSNTLHAVIKASLRAGDTDWGGRLADTYRVLHEDVLREKHLLGFSEASAALSHARLVCQLASEELMSAAQIARVLSARDSRLELGWRGVRDLLGRLGLQPSLGLARAQSLFEADARMEEESFSDAGFLDAATLVGEVAMGLGFPDDLEALLTELFDSGLPDRWHGPYLQILHYVCVIAEFYDHAPSYVYEFAPRGIDALWIFDQYPADLRAAGNPVLNNAKSVDRIDAGWAQSKEGKLLGPASALEEIVAGLEQMGFAARQELAGWIRRWLLRIIRLTRPMAVTVPELSSPAQVRAVLACVSEPTQTLGVLEQRVVDAVTLVLHPISDGWRSHGLGDSVNTSNISRRKIGDCEYVNAARREIRAYESHGGDLSEVYLESHLQTLRRVMPLRISELERVAPVEDWDILVTFVAHTFSCAPRETQISGCVIRIAFVTMSDLGQLAGETSQIVEIFTRHINGRLNEPRTPERVRHRYLAICEE